MRRAKIVATLGPATSSYEQIRAIVDAGVDVARLNLSHGDYSVHEQVYANVRKAAEDSGRAVGIFHIHDNGHIRDTSSLNLKPNQ